MCILLRCVALLFLALLSGCTYSVVVNGNAGSGADAVTETDTVDPVISPTISVVKEL